MTGAGGFIVSVRVAVRVPPVLVALKRMENLPGEDGVPLINPVEVLIVSPGGSPVAL